MWMPGEIAVHKSFFMYWTFFVFVSTIVGTIIAVYTNWWQLLILAIGTSLFLQYWYIGWPALTITALGFYVWYHRRQVRIKRERSAAVERQRIQRLISGGDTK
jgi:uncharacterized BrkB/YihY/UPF0761 family membrane protein